MRFVEISNFSQHDVVHCMFHDHLLPTPQASSEVYTHQNTTVFLNNIMELYEIMERLQESASADDFANLFNFPSDWTHLSNNIANYFVNDTSSALTRSFH